MKYIKLGIALIVLVCFVSIQTSYNGSPSSSIFSALIEYGLNEVLILSFDNFALQFLIISLFVIISAILKGRIIMIIGLTMLFCLLLYWVYTIGRIIDFHILTIIPFITTFTLAILFLIREELKERMEKGENK